MVINVGGKDSLLTFFLIKSLNPFKISLSNEKEGTDIDIPPVEREQKDKTKAKK